MSLAPPGYHNCPSCHFVFPCDKRTTGNGRQRPFRINPNHYSVIAILQAEPTEWFTPRRIQYLLSDRKVARWGRRVNWSIAQVAEVLTELLGRNYVKTQTVKKGNEWLYQFSRALDVPLGSVV